MQVYLSFQKNLSNLMSNYLSYRHQKWFTSGNLAELASRYDEFKQRFGIVPNSKGVKGQLPLFTLLAPKYTKVCFKARDV